MWARICQDFAWARQDNFWRRIILQSGGPKSGSRHLFRRICDWPSRSHRVASKQRSGISVRTISLSECKPMQQLPVLAGLLLLLAGLLGSDGQALPTDFVTGSVAAPSSLHSVVRCSDAQQNRHHPQLHHDDLFGWLLLRLNATVNDCHLLVWQEPPVRVEMCCESCMGPFASSAAPVKVLCTR